MSRMRASSHLWLKMTSMSESTAPKMASCQAGEAGSTASPLVRVRVRVRGRVRVRVGVGVGVRVRLGLWLGLGLGLG